MLYTNYAVGVSTALIQGGTYWGTRWDFALSNCYTSTIQENTICGGDEPKIEFGRFSLAAITLFRGIAFGEPVSEPAKMAGMNIKMNQFSI